MQLIFETQPTEDFITKMSTQAQTPINGDVSDINVVNELAVNENKLTLHDRSMKLKENDKIAPEVTKESILKKENNTNEVENGEFDLETTEGIPENDLLENINNIIGEGSTSEASNSQEENTSGSEYKNLNANISVTLTVDSTNISKEDCLKSNNENNTFNNGEDVFNAEINSKTSDVESMKSSSQEKNNLEVVNFTDTDMIEDSKTVNEDIQSGLNSNNDTNILISNHADENMKMKENENVGRLESPYNVPNHTDENIKITEKENVERLESPHNVPTSLETDVPIHDHENSPTNDFQELVGEPLREGSIKLIAKTADNDDNLETHMSSDGLSLEPSINMDGEMEHASDINNEEKCSNRICDNNTSKSLNFENCTEKNISIDEESKCLRVLAKNKDNDEHSSIKEILPENDVMGADNNKLAHLLGENETSNEPSLVYEKTDVSNSNTIIGEKDKLSHIVEDIENNSSSNIDELTLVYESSPSKDDKNSEDVSMNEELRKPTILDTSISTIDKVNTLNEEKIIDDTLLETSHINNSEDISMETDKIKESENPAAVTNTEVTPIADDVDMHEIEEKSYEETQSGKELNTALDKSIISNEETNLTIVDTAMIERSDIAIDKPFNNDINTVNIQQGLSLENSTNDQSLTVDSSNKEVFVEKVVENVRMDVDDVRIVELDKDNQDYSTNAVNSQKIEESTDNSTGNIDEFRNKVTPATEVGESEGMGPDSIENIDSAPSEQNKPEDVILNDQDMVEVLDEDDIKIVENKEVKAPKAEVLTKSHEPKETKTLPVVCKLSNTLDILSDDEDEIPKEESKKTEKSLEEKHCINIDDDDDIMILDEDDFNSKDAANEKKIEGAKDVAAIQSNPASEEVLESREHKTNATDIEALSPKINEKESSPVNNTIKELGTLPNIGKTTATETEKPEEKKPLLPQNFLKTAKKNLAEMTRDELEDFCILRIVESIVDRSNLSDIKTKIKTMAQNLEDYKKRAMMLTKQNRDLQVVLKSVQEEQKKRAHSLIQPLKITRSVGMQVLMNDKIDARRKGPIPCQPATPPVGRPGRALQPTKTTKPSTPPSIPVPRKVPVNSPAKVLANTPNNNTKTTTPNTNGVRNPSPVQKVPEKRTHSRMQASSSVTVDLTDDEPPPKINNKNTVSPPVRVVPQQNLMAPQRFGQPLNSPRKVYIPISGQQALNIRPGQTLVMRNVAPNGPRQRVPPLPRMQGPIRINKPVAPAAPNRHPAPLPDAMKQYTPPTWKALPPAPDLKLSKVENGIVISWKIDGYPDGGYETIASYQLYAYQETSAPPSTALWKKIGDVKALPLPMACTLTQFMAGFKYYFAVRAVDVRSRLGPFSLPGSILLLNKV